MKIISILKTSLLALLAVSLGGCVDGEGPRSYSGGSVSPSSYNQDPSTCTHEYNSWTVTKAPDCTHDGVKTRTCTKCGQIENVSIPATGHEFHNGVCTICGAEESEESSSSVE